MEFAKYYDVTEYVKELCKNKELECYVGCDFKGVYVCEDSNDYWIVRISKGYNADFEEDENSYLAEREKISLYDVADKLSEAYGRKLPQFDTPISDFAYRNEIKRWIDRFSDKQIIKAVLQIDDFNGLENWDCWDSDSMDEIIRDIDGGFGIMKMVA